MHIYIHFLAKMFQDTQFGGTMIFGKETENKIEVSIFVEIEISSNCHQVLETFNTVLIVF